MASKNDSSLSNRGEAGIWPIEVSGPLQEVQALLDAGRTNDALTYLRKVKQGSPWLENAVAVCQLRLGNVRSALDTYRRLTLAPGGLFFNQDVPDVFKANFAVALALDGNVSGALRMLTEARVESHPVACELRAAVRAWETRMSLWQSVVWWLGGSPPTPFTMETPPGRLG